jgi:hypothetical protein
VYLYWSCHLDKDSDRCGCGIPIEQKAGGAGLPDLSWFKIPKREKYITNDSKVYQTAIKYIKLQYNISNNNKK